MRPRFCQTTNVRNFLDGVARLNGRGAPEASLMLVTGDAGYGKSRTGHWWATQQNAVHVRIKAAATPHWLLTDLVRELGETAPAHTCEKLFAQAFNITAREQPPLVIDEVENALHDIKVLDTLRDLSDLADVPVILIGRESVVSRLRRERQIWSRISSLVPFTAATVEDVRLCCDELAEVEIADEVVAEIHRQSEGRIREVMKALANVERLGRRAGGKVAMKDIEGRPLTPDYQRQRPKLKAV